MLAGKPPPAGTPAHVAGNPPGALKFSNGVARLARPLTGAEISRGFTGKVTGDGRALIRFQGRVFAVPASRIYGLSEKLAAARHRKSSLTAEQHAGLNSRVKAIALAGGAVAVAGGAIAAGKGGGCDKPPCPQSAHGGDQDSGGGHSGSGGGNSGSGGGNSTGATPGCIPPDSLKCQFNKAAAPTNKAATTTRQPLRTKAMDKMFDGEHLPNNPQWHGKGVRYLNEAERAEHKLSISNGKVYDSKGNLFDTSARADGSGIAIFVMDEHGNLYASKYHKSGDFAHSSFLAGKPVAAAGEIEVRKGVLTAVSDRSGHYKPPSEFLDQAMKRLAEDGIDMSGVSKKTW